MTESGINKLNYAFGAAVVVAAVYLAWPTKPAEPAKNILEGTPTKRVSVDAVVYEDAAKKKLHLPKQVQVNPAKQVSAATRTENDDREHEVTAVLDTTTGQTVLYDRPLDRPWLSSESKVHIGVFGGVYENGMPGIRAEAKYEFARVKALHVGLHGSVDYIPSDPSDTRGFVGVGIWGSF